MTEEKKFYAEYEADNIMNPLNIALVDAIKAEQPESVFEFGCGTGKHLRELPMPSIGVDISQKNITKAYTLRVNTEREKYLVGDERLIPSIRAELSFTCSVICHMKPEDAEKAVRWMQRNSKVVILAETQETPSKFYWNHDYAKWGFHPSGGWESPGNHCFYRIWKWRPLS